MRMAFYLCGLPPQNPEVQSNYEKNIRQIPIEGHPTKYLASTPENSLRSSKMRKKKLSQGRGDRRHGN